MISDQFRKHVSRKLSLRKILIALYGGVVALVFIALVFIVQDETSPPLENIRPVVDQEEVSAIVSSLVASAPSIQSQTPRPGQTSVAILRREPKHEEVTAPVEKLIPVWQQNAIQSPAIPGPRIAIIIDDMGLAEQASFAFAEMQGPFTLSYLPYANNLESQTAMVRRAGHELMVHMPMEPGTNADPGPHALLSNMTEADFDAAIDWNLNRFDGFVGVNNHMGSLLTENPALMVRLMVHLRRGGYLFLDSLTSPKSVGLKAAKATGVPVAERDVFLDNERSMVEILNQLEETEKIAEKRGYAIAIGHPYPETLKALEFWLVGLRERNIHLVPISQIVNSLEAESQMASAPQPAPKSED